ncbi:integrase, catalytic region, zinc finger, CCHC-type containing protein [Tanacetum coccineum]
MSTQQDIYAADSENCPPILNKDNYVPWSSRLLCYAKSKPNGKLLVKSILEGPYQYRMIEEPGDPNHTPLVLPSSHLQTDDELTATEAKQVKADDQNVGNQVGQNAVQNSAARAKGNGNGDNAKQIRCYNCRKVGHYARNCTVKLRRRDADAAKCEEIEEVNANYILMANLQQVSTSGTHADKAPIYNSDGSAEFMGTVHFRNDQVVTILVYDVLQWGNMLITWVHFVEGLGHNLFSVGQFCDSDFEVAFRRNSCFVNLDGVDRLKGNRSTNLYTINLHEITSESLICLMARATSTKSWLWHQRLSHLNFETINTLAKYNLVTGRPKFKYTKDHLCPSCEQGKSKKSPHKPKPVLDSKNRLHLLHMNLCGPMKVESINGKRALCYPKNDHEDIGKLGAKGDISFFIGFYSTSCAYRVYNRRTKKVMETMNVTFDELSAMAFEQRSSKPKLQGMTSGHISLRFVLTYAPSTITSQKPTERDLQLLFEAMYDDYIGGQPLDATRTSPTAPSTLNLQTPVASTTTLDNGLTPTNSSTSALAIPNNSQDVEELQQQQQQHFQQQLEQPQLQSEEVADNVNNVLLDENITMELRNVKEAMTNARWIEAMQDELLQFKWLDVWELVPYPDNIKPLTLKLLFKNNLDEEQTVIRIKARLVVRGYRQEEGIDFE